NWPIAMGPDRRSASACGRGACRGPCLPGHGTRQTLRRLRIVRGASVQISEHPHSRPPPRARHGAHRLLLAGRRAALMAAALAACTERDTVVLGASIPVTGLFTKAGLSYRDAYQIAIDRINERGGISLGGARRQLALTLLDNESDSKLALQQHEELA